MEKKNLTKPKARVRDAEETQRRVLQASQELFSQKGFAGVRLHEIAAKAGVTVPLLCHHFRDKESLYQATQEQLLARFAQLGQEIFSAPGSAPERLEGSTIAPRQPARQSIGIERAMSLHDRSHEGAAPAAASAALGQRLLRSAASRTNQAPIALTAAAALLFSVHDCGGPRAGLELVRSQLS